MQYYNSNIHNAIQQYFDNIEWCMKRGMLDGVHLLLDNIPPYIIPFVYFDNRSCRLLISAYVYGCSYMIDIILRKLVYFHFINKIPTKINKQHSKLQ